MSSDRRAIILGASIAGLLTACVLCEHFAEVVLLERDELPDPPEPRNGTPHAVHPHGLLARGREILERLFPGFSDALIGQGAIAGDVATDAAVDANGRCLAQRESGLMALAVSRLAIEVELRRRVRALPRARIVTDVNVLAPVQDSSVGRVTAVRYRSRTGTYDAHFACRWVGGGLHRARARISPTWLIDWGYELVPEERVVIGLCYTSAYFVRDGGVRPPIAAIIGAATPELAAPLERARSVRRRSPLSSSAARPLAPLFVTASRTVNAGTMSGCSAFGADTSCSETR